MDGDTPETSLPPPKFAKLNQTRTSYDLGDDRRDSVVVVESQTDSDGGTVPDDSQQEAEKVVEEEEEWKATQVIPEPLSRYGLEFFCSDTQGREAAYNAGRAAQPSSGQPRQGASAQGANAC